MPKPEYNSVTTEEDKVRKVVQMISDLRTLQGADSIYIFSKYFTKIDIDLPTIFGVLANFPSFEVFSQDKVKGFKKIVNENSELLTGFIRIGTDVYQADHAHEYKILPQRRAREIIKATAFRAVKISRFDLSMMDPSWLTKLSSHREAVAAHPEHTMNESDNGGEFEDAGQAIQVGLSMLKQHTGNVEHDESDMAGMMDALADCTTPFWVEPIDGGNGIQIVGANDMGLCMFNNDGKLYWEF